MLLSIALTVFFQVTAAHVEAEDQASSHFDQGARRIADVDSPRSGALRRNVKEQPDAEAVVHPQGMKRQKVWRSLSSARSSNPRNVVFEGGVAHVEYDIDTTSLARRSGSKSHKMRKRSALRLLRGNVANSPVLAGTAQVLSTKSGKQGGQAPSAAKANKADRLKKKRVPVTQKTVLKEKPTQ